MIERRRACLLNREKLTAVGIVFAIAVRFHEQWIANDKPERQPVHVERFAHRMQFHRDLFRARGAENRSGLLSNTNAAYAASETITSLCFNAKSTAYRKNPVVALAPEGCSDNSAQ